ncbi:Histone deacetylase 10 [Strongyloides ratti]|uniref:Histone deacetylase 10 n=1 Tax=Strongyloides ratti TaxID=34506 RepID=A0A090L0U2_STRRB|nr:Histone deacetylase 10 [Strongyloides ratti]CEF63291.1 Histone deacetylase 10 [Strongyloides ratti]
MLKHKNVWDHFHAESPDRMTAILDMLENEKLNDKLTKISHISLSKNDIALVHPMSYIEKLENLCKNGCDKDREDFCKKHDSIYMVSETYDCALRAVECCWSITKSVLENRKSNGFALVRPPGHHAYSDNPNGFCFFNNISICAKKAMKDYDNVRKILIIDWDIHSGQGTQFSIKDCDPNIQLISIHRYENGKYWPHLVESNFDESFSSNTLNIPLNEVGLNDFHYIHIMCKVVFPFIFNFKPDLILVSCGYDAAIGDPKGEMMVSPYFYGLMTRLLSSLSIPLALFYEGGYLIESITISAKETISGLIDREIFNYYKSNLPPDNSINFKNEFFWMINKLTSHNNLHKNINTLNYYLTQNTIQLSPLYQPSKEELKIYQFTPPAITRGVYTQLSNEEITTAHEYIVHSMKCQNIENDTKNLIHIDFNDEKKILTFTGNKHQETISIVIDDLTIFTFILTYIIIPNIFCFTSNENFDKFLSNWNIMTINNYDENLAIKSIIEKLFSKFNLQYY